MMKEEMRIRRLQESDLADRVKWMNNPAVYSTMHFDLPIQLDKTKRWFENNLQNQTRCDVVFEDKEDGLIGMGGLTSIDPTLKKAELYIFVNPEKQHGGIGSKATRLLCEYGFEKLNLNKIYLYTNESNKAAIRVYEKVGFKNVGKFRNENVTEDGLEDRLYFEMFPNELNKEFEKKPLKSNLFMKVDKVKIGDEEIMIVRDDLYPSIGGGNKGRKAEYYEIAMRSDGYNACVTTGGIQSNHNRAIALMCAKNGWRCHNVYHGTRERFEEEEGNALLVRRSGATYEFVEANEIGSAMDVAMDRLKAEGYNPMYIHGGGHDIPGGVALVEAIKALKLRCEEQRYKPAYIFHASGTGSTQAGIAVGLDLVGWSDVKLVGISVARQKERGTQVIEEFANQLASHYELNNDYTGKINFITDYLCGGYEKYTPEMAEYLDEAMKKTGIMFDTTYSGKAFYGMMDYIKKNNITGNVLFWHTGGLMNLMK